jgi:hypothetical protein
MSIGQQPIQLLGFYVAGVLCVGMAVLKLTVEGHWSWWRVLLPLWAVLGHNILYIVIGFIWLSFVSPGPPGEEENITIRKDTPQRYELAAMVCFLLFAHTLLERLEGSSGQGMGVWLGTGQWQLLLVLGLLSLLFQLFFWSEIVQVNHRFTRKRE